MSHTRRRFLATSTFVGFGLARLRTLQAQQSSSDGWKAHVQNYLSSLARDDGGYGWDDQPHSHLTPTFAVIGSAHILGWPLEKKQQLSEYVRTHHPMTLKPLEQEHRLFDYQQLQSLIWLDSNVDASRKSILSWKRPVQYLKQYEKAGNPVFIHEVSAIVSRQLLGQNSKEIPEEFRQYLRLRCRENGTFNNTPAEDGSDGHILNTCWGLLAQAALNELPKDPTLTIDWLNSCQTASGGFTYRPDARLGGIDDVAYTWAGVTSLKTLGHQVANCQSCIQFLQNLFNEDGGFSDRPGWCSNAMATYYALDALKQMDALDTIENPFLAGKRRRSNKSSPLPTGLNVYSIQIEAHGQGSPKDAVLLANSLKIHLWGAKNAKPNWIRTAQALADQQHVPVRFFGADEEYGTWVHIDGQGTYSHTSDIVYPGESNHGSTLADQGVVSWADYRQRRLAPLLSAQGRLVWQFGENEPLARMLLDDSIQRGGFAAISTFHFGNPDFTNTEPFLNRYRMQLPFIALQDAHGPEPWWFADMTEGFRTLFLAQEPTWEGFLKALKENWIIAVRHDAISNGKTWMHGGSPAVRNVARQQFAQWQWWDNTRIQRPPASIQVLSKDDSFESGAPEDKHQLRVRVRCTWQNTPQGLAKQPIYELLKLTLNDQQLSTELQSKRRPNGLFEDHFHLTTLPTLSDGKHTLRATLRRLSDDKTVELVQTEDLNSYLSNPKILSKERD